MSPTGAAGAISHTSVTQFLQFGSISAAQNTFNQTGINPFEAVEKVTIPASAFASSSSGHDAPSFTPLAIKECPENSGVKSEIDPKENSAADSKLIDFDDVNHSEMSDTKLDDEFKL